MKKTYLIILLVLTSYLTSFFVLVPIRFAWVVSQDVFDDAIYLAEKLISLTQLTAFIHLGTFAGYFYLVKKNPVLSEKSKQNWYVALWLAAPISMPMYWFKHAWPAAKDHPADAASATHPPIN